MIKVILAAGKGNRLKNTFPKDHSYITKALVTFNGEPAIKRLLKQAENINGDTIVVLGHKAEAIKKIINFSNCKIIINENYMNDSNLQSLQKAINYIFKEALDMREGILIIEADSYFQTNMLINFILYLNLNKKDLSKKNTICWTTKGLAKNNDSGGFIEPLANYRKQERGNIFDVYIAGKKKSNYSKKLYGLTWLNENSIKAWLKQSKYIINSEKNKKTLYFHDVFFKNKKEYYMKFYDMSSKALSFNDYKEYIFCLNSN